VVLLQVVFSYSSSREQKIQNSEQDTRRPTIFFFLGGVLATRSSFLGNFGAIFLGVRESPKSMFSLADGKEENDSDLPFPPPSLWLSVTLKTSENPLSLNRDRLKGSTGQSF